MMLLSSFFNILYIVMAIFGILAIGGLTGRERKEKKKEIKVKDAEIRYKGMPDPPVSDEFVTYVGGARFYVKKDELRSFVGFVYHDPEEEAPKIYRNDMHLMGHIPRERLKEYSIWCPGETYPCVGYVLRGKTVEDINTNLKVIKPYNKEYVDSEVKKFVKWVTMTYGMDANISPEIYEPILSEQEIEKFKKKHKGRRRKDD